MLKNILKTAIRSLRRNSFYATLNLLGLVLGMGVILVVYLIYSYETNFDTFHPGAERVYRINSSLDFNGNKNFNRGTPEPVLDLVKLEVPELEAVALYRYQPLQGWKALREGEEFAVENSVAAAVNPDYFEIFSHDWIEGSPQAFFASSNGLVISESMARNLFGGNAMGRGLVAVHHKYDTGEDIRIEFQVVGVVKDALPNSDFKTNIFVAASQLETYLGKQTEWGNVSSNHQVFVRFHPQAKMPEAITKVEEIVSKKFQASENSFIHKWAVVLKPLSEIHFDGIFGHDNPRKATKGSLQVLLVVGIIVLLSACINFINLSTAFSFLRSKEVGIRKVVGSPRVWLVLQYLVETALLVTVAGILSLALIELAVPKMGPIYELGLEGSLLGYFLTKTEFLLFFAGFVVVLSLLSGLYPALVISGFNPIKAFKNNLQGQGTALVLRRSLVVVQFGLSIVLVFGTLLVNRQLNFLKSKDLGFDHSHTAYFQLPSNADSKAKGTLLKERVKQLPFVEEASLGGALIISPGWSRRTAEFYREGEKVESFFNTKSVDPEFFSAFQMPFVAGKPFEDGQQDVLVINESMARELGAQSPEEALEMEIFINEKALRIAGVVQDFHFTSVKREIEPIMFERIENGSVFTFRLGEGDFQAQTQEIVAMAK